MTRNAETGAEQSFTEAVQWCITEAELNERHGHDRIAVTLFRDRSRDTFDLEEASLLSRHIRDTNIEFCVTMLSPNYFKPDDYFWPVAK